MSVLHTILCAAMIVACLWRWKYVSDGPWDRRIAYTAILGGCSASLLWHWHAGETVARAGMAWLILAGAFREQRAELKAKTKQPAQKQGREIPA